MGTTLTTPQNTNEWPIYNALVPKEGPRCVPFVVPFATAAGPYLIDLQQMVASKRMTVCQSIFIDNTGNDSPLIVNVGGSNQNIVCPSEAQGYFPILTPALPRFTIDTQGTGNVQVIFINVPVPAAVWSGVSETSIADAANGPVTPAAPGTASKLIGAVYYAPTGIGGPGIPTPVSGDQQALNMDGAGNLLVFDSALATAINAYNQYFSRVSVVPGGAIGTAGGIQSASTVTVAATSTELVNAGNVISWVGIQAPITADVWINPRGGTAGIGLTDCFRIPMGTFYESKAPCTLGGDIFYYCATGGLQLTCLYG